MELTHQKILVTGASGSLGKQLLYEMSQRGIKPLAQVRKTSNLAYIDSLGLEKRYADLQNRREHAGLLDGVDAVIHTVAWVNFRGDRLTQFTDLNTLVALDLFRHAQEAGVRRFVHVSTVAAVGAVPRRQSGPVTDVVADEDMPFNLEHLNIPYIQTKRAAEVELQKLGGNGPTELVIVNPSIIIAPSRTGDDRGKALKRFGRFFMPQFPNRVNLVDIRDVAPGILSALEKSRPGQRYILGGDNVSVRDLILAISATLGRQPHLFKPPRPLLEFAGKTSAMLAKMFAKSKVSFYPDLVKLLDYDWVYSSRKAREELGYTNRSVQISLNELLTNSFAGTYLKPRPPR